MYSILHIEKNDFFRKIVKHILIEKGFSYYPADNTDDAYRILEQTHIDLIITSYLIDDDSIENFIQDINNSDYKDIPIFVTTSNSTSEKLMNLGVTDYINKESLSDELLKHIDVVLKDDQLSNLLKSSKIAILDDSHLESKITKDLLIKNGINNVDCYSSGNDLLNIGKKYDLYLIDMILQNEYGRNVVMNVRRNNINASIIIVTALSNEKTIASILNAGADDYIMKPIHEDLFISKLKSNLRVLASVRSMEGKMVSLMKKIDQQINPT